MKPGNQRFDSEIRTWEDEFLARLSGALTMSASVLNLPDAEPHFQYLLEQLENDHDHVDQFCESMVKLIDLLPPGSVEVLSYCLHELQWQRCRERVQLHLESSVDLDRRGKLSRILAAYSSSWDFREIYERFRGE